MVAAPVLMRMPWWTLGLAAAALLAQWLPGAAEWAAYQREGVLQGELWRIVTGHFVHFSAAHLANNLVVLLPAAWLVETRHRADFAPLLLGSAISIGLAVLIGEPGIADYRGASGVALAFLVYACLSGLQERGRWRDVCIAVLAIVVAKCVAEGAGWQLREWQANEGFVPLAVSHFAGAATGGLVCLCRSIGLGRAAPRPNAIR